MSDNINIDDMNDNNNMMITDDDKLWSALSWVFFPLAIIALLMEDKKSRPFIRYNAWHSIVTGVIFSIIASVTLGCGSLIFILSFVYAYKAYQGETVEIPVVSDFIKNQGWV